MYSLFKTIAAFFSILGILFIPFPFNVFSCQEGVARFIFGELIDVVLIRIFSVEYYLQEISSDSLSMYALLLILLCSSIVLSVMLIKMTQIKIEKLINLFHTIICYYLMLQLFNYGMDKVFKGQFYLPEPNILYTPMGFLDKDMLFWSTMGSSYSYNLFMGFFQLLVAFLILVNKTRTLGLILSCGIFINIVAINFSFDISVKLYASFLLFLSAFALSPNLKRMYVFFIMNQTSSLERNRSEFNLTNQSFAKAFLKTFAVLLVLLEVCYPYLTSRSFNDDLTERPFLHGAYEVNQTSETSEFLLADKSNSIKRFFIHRKGYLIFQDQDNMMTDYKLSVGERSITLTDYSLNELELDYQYFSKDSILRLNYFNQGINYELEGKSLDWKSLPLIQNQFHWAVDGID